MAAKTITLEVTEAEFALVQAGLELMRVRLSEKDEESTGLRKLVLRLCLIRPPGKEILLSMARKNKET